MRFSKRLITQTPECLTEPVGQLLNVIISTLFALVFLTAYVPFSETAWFQVGKSNYFFITAAFVGSGMMFLALSRVLMNWVIRKSRHFPFWLYLLWLFLEIMIIAQKYFFFPSKASFLLKIAKSILTTSCRTKRPTLLFN